MHGERPILGLRFGPFAYLTDCSQIPESSWPLLHNLDVLVHRRAAAASASDPLLAVGSDRSRAADRRRADLLHPHVPRSAPRRDKRALPDGMALAYDGLAELECR